MAHRQSCERCRQQKVRCLRDEQTVQVPSPGQSIPRCSRCAKAGATCVYSLRSRVRRSGSSTASRVLQVQPSAADKYPTPFDSIEDNSTCPFQLDFDGLNWDQLSAYPPLQSSGIGSQPQSAMDHGPHHALDVNHSTETQVDGQWWSGVISPLSSSSKPETINENISAAAASNSLQGLTSQAMAISAQAISATRKLLCPGSIPPAASSNLVNKMFESTRTLVSIMNSVMTLATTGNDSDGIESSDDGGCTSAEIGGLVLTTLACHQHLLAFFKGVCYSVEQCIESADEKRPGSSASSLHCDELPTIAQFTMLLQLLVHLIGRLDRCLFPSKPSSTVSSSTSAYGPSSSENMEEVQTLEETEAEDFAPDMARLPSLAHSMVRAIPEQHLRLRQTILRLQGRLERLEAF